MQMKDLLSIMDGKKPITESTINESPQEVEIIGYNSGTGNQLHQAAKDPKTRRKVKVVSMDLGFNGQPVLKFNELSGDGPFVAEWHPQYGWHADFS